MIEAEYQQKSSGFRTSSPRNPEILPISPPGGNPQWFPGGSDSAPDLMDFHQPLFRVDDGGSFPEVHGETRQHEVSISANIQTGQALAFRRVPPVGEAFRIGWALPEDKLREELDPARHLVKTTWSPQNHPSHQNRWKSRRRNYFWGCGHGSDQTLLSFQTAR